MVCTYWFILASIESRILVRQINSNNSSTFIKAFGFWCATVNKSMNRFDAYMLPKGRKVVAKYTLPRKNVYRGDVSHDRFIQYFIAEAKFLTPSAPKDFMEV